MDKTEIALIDQKYKTVCDLLEATRVDSQHLGASSSICYAFRDPELQDFVFRIRKDITQLKKTTILYTMPNLLIGDSLGQPLLGTKDGEISILLKQPGKSLVNWGFKPDHPHSYAKSRFKALSLITDTAAQTGNNPFTPLLRQAYRIVASGGEVDALAGNILLDEKTGALHWVDQVTPKQTAKSVWAFALPFSPDRAHLEIGHIGFMLIMNICEGSGMDLNAEETKLYDEKINQVAQLITQATEIVKQEGPPLSQFTFANPAKPCKSVLGKLFGKVYETHAIALTDRPSKLVAELNRLQGIINTPAR